MILTVTIIWSSDPCTGVVYSPPTSSPPTNGGKIVILFFASNMMSSTKKYQRLDSFASVPAHCRDSTSLRSIYRDVFTQGMIHSHIMRLYSWGKNSIGSRRLDHGRKIDGMAEDIVLSANTRFLI